MRLGHARPHSTGRHRAPDRPGLLARRRPGLRLAGTLLAPAVAAGGLLGAQAAPAAAATHTWQSGVYTGGCDPNGATTFGTWRGDRPARVMSFLPSNSWSALANPTWAVNCWKGKGYQVTYSVPMLPNSGASIQSGARGHYDSYFRQLGRTLVNGGSAYSTLRIGWEMNGAWFNWTASKDPTSWKQYWVHIVNALRSVPGQHFTYDWSPGNGQGASHFDVASAYPGDAYVTYVGQSLYDFAYGQPHSTHQRTWGILVNQAYGLKWQAAFAAAHHKQLAYSEWALCNTSDYGHGGGGDDPYFVTSFHSWLASHNTAFDIYFDRDHSSTDRHALNSGTRTSSEFYNAGTAYRNLF